MVLSSQVPRTGFSPRYVTTRRRKAGPGRWVALTGLFALGVAGLFWLVYRDVPQDTHAATISDSTTATKPTTPIADNPGQAPGQTFGPPHQRTPSTRSGDGSAASNPAGPGRFAAVKTTNFTPEPTAMDAAPRAGSQTDRGSGVGSPLQRRLEQLHSDDIAQVLEARRALSAMIMRTNANANAQAGPSRDPQSLTAEQAEVVRDALSEVNQSLVFSPRRVPDDAVTRAYVVQSGDALIKIANRFDLTYPLIERINGIQARSLRAGQTIKVINGPIHARVVKHDYRMDLFVWDDDVPIYLCSFPVGLGEDNATPVGMWVVEPGRKVKNPSWSDPRSGRFFAADDPENPLGGYWLALQGTDDRTMGLSGYGIHGTIDPNSIGADMSLGCIRMRGGDIELVYEMLVEGRSTVEVQP